MTEDNNLGLEFKYLIVNDMDRKFGLWVNTVGYQSIPPDSPYPLKEHPSGYYFNAEKGRVLREYQLVYITKGRGLFSSDSTPERQVCKGRLMVLFPGQWHIIIHCGRPDGRNITLVLKVRRLIRLWAMPFFLRKDRYWKSVLMKNWYLCFPALWKWQKRIKYLPSNTFPESYFT